MPDITINFHKHDGRLGTIEFVGYHVNYFMLTFRPVHLGFQLSKCENLVCSRHINQN